MKRRRRRRRRRCGLDPFPLSQASSFTTREGEGVGHSEQEYENSQNEKVGLQRLTIKELWEVIEEEKLDTTGWPKSKLRLKADIISFISDQMDNSSTQDNVVTHDKTQDLETVSEMNHEESFHSSPRRNSISSKSQEEPQRNVNPPRLRHSPLRGMPPLLEDTDETIRSSSSSSPTPKEEIYNYVLKRYHPLANCVDTTSPSSSDYTQHTKLEGLGDRDIRQSLHPMLAPFAGTSSDLDVVFVGTASCVPGITRGVSCTALRLNWRRHSGFSSDVDIVHNNNNNKHDKPYVDSSRFDGGTWLFDCGESTQLQIQRTGSVRPSKITKIFLTHAHGDHTFGLPGLLCIMGQDREQRASSPPIDIYGPEGLRTWLRIAIRYSVSRIVPSYRVHEIMDVPMAPEWMEHRTSNGRYYYRPGRQQQQHQKRARWQRKGLAGEDPSSWITQCSTVDNVISPSEQFGEVKGGRDIYPIYDHPQSSDGAPIWEIEDIGDVRVRAAPMSHGVPCVGYVIEEQSRPGRLRQDYVRPIVERNIDGLREMGMKIPMKIMAHIKEMPKGTSYTFPDGTVVHQEDAVEEARRGRKIVICGDTADARAMEGLSQNADLVIHEATNAYLAGIDKDTSQQAVSKDAKIHGHSTPLVAGAFAKRVRAKNLVMNHFSSRYKGDLSLDSLSIMTRIERQAMKVSGLNETNVAAAWDFMILPIPRN